MPRIDWARFGIRARLLTLLLPVVVGLLILDSWNDSVALRNLIHDAYDRPMLDSVNSLRSSIVVSPDGSLRLIPPFGLQAVLDSSQPGHTNFHVGLRPREPKDHAAPVGAEITLLGAPDLPAPPAPMANDPGSPAVWYDSVYKGDPVRVVALQERMTDGRGQEFDLLIQAAENPGRREEAQRASRRQELIGDGRMVLAVILLVWLGVEWSLHPLERLRRSVLQSKSDELKPLDTTGVPHEVAPLVEAVNQHLSSYREILDRQSQFLADASHQLRTPLAIMLTQAGVALREKDPEQWRQTLRAMTTQIARSRRLCEQLLSLAHASDSTPPDAPELVDLNAIAKDVVLQYLAFAHEKGRDLGWMSDEVSEGIDGEPTNDGAATLPDPAPVRVIARSAELHEVISNLVHNAIVYTPTGGRITVSVSTRDGQAIAEVRDDGPGIAPERRAEVFERFHHTSENLGKGARGAGLGLAIARAYAKRNGGDIELADADGGNKRSVTIRSGLRAILHIPLAPDEKI